MERGRFLVLEGPDGSGKSEQIGRLIEEVVNHRENLDPMALQFCFVADRIDHVRGVVEPALATGKWVISDRYWPSTVAYGGMGELGKIFWLNLNREVVLDPDLIVWLDVPVEECLRRGDGRGGVATIFEKKEKLEAVYQGYEWQIKRLADMWLRVDGNRRPEVIAEEIRDEIKSRGLINGE